MINVEITYLALIGANTGGGERGGASPLILFCHFKQFLYTYMQKNIIKNLHTYYIQRNMGLCVVHPLIPGAVLVFQPRGDEIF